LEEEKVPVIAYMLCEIPSRNTFFASQKPISVDKRLDIYGY